MKKRTLQILKYLTLPCLFSCLSLLADEQEEDKMHESHMNADHKSVDMTFCQTYDMLKTKRVAPYAGPAVDGGIDAYIKTSYILWHVSQERIDYAYYGVADANLPKVEGYFQPQGRVVSPKFKTSSGFKAALGMDFSYDGWDLGLNYTWLHTHVKSFVENDGDKDDSDDIGSHQTLLPTHAIYSAVHNPLDVRDTLDHSDSSGLVIHALDKAGSSWRLNFNVLDLELGRNFFVSPKLLIRPHYGLKGTWQKQNQFIFYESSGVADDVTVSGVTVTTASGTKITVGKGSKVTTDIQSAEEFYELVNHQSYWGFGPRAGMNLSWLMTRNFSFFTDTAVSLLWGQFKSTRLDAAAAVDLTTNAVLFSDYTPVNMRFRTHGVNAVVEMQLGLRYDYWFSNDEYRFRAQAGWENQLWFDQNQFVYGHEISVGDLSLQGFTLTFQFDF